jgi:hypothetical protein
MKRMNRDNEGWNEGFNKKYCYKEEKIKAKMSLYLSKNHAMKTYG